MSKYSVSEKYQYDPKSVFEEVNSLFDSEDFKHISKIGKELLESKTLKREDSDLFINSTKFILTLAKTEQILGDFELSERYLCLISNSNPAIYVKNIENKSVPTTKLPHTTGGLIDKFVFGKPDKITGYKTEKINKSYFREIYFHFREQKILNLIHGDNIHDARLELTKLSKEIGEAQKDLDDSRAKEVLNTKIEQLSQEFALKCMLEEIIKEQNNTIEAPKFSKNLLKPYLNLSKDKLNEIIGGSISKSAKDIYRSTDYQILLLSKGKDVYIINSGRTSFPEHDLSEVVKSENISFGIKLTKALKRSLYNTLCDKDNRVGQSMIDKDKISKLIFNILVSIGITASPIIGSISALILFYGLDVYCDMAKPEKSIG